MITFLFKVTVKSGREKDFYDLAARLTEVTRKEDDGCITYVFHQQRDKPNEFMLYEQWRDQESLDAHLNNLVRLLGPSESGGRLPAAFLELCEKTETTNYDVVPLPSGCFFK